MNDYLAVYLVGCALVVVLTILKIIIFWTLDWITKENILNKNIKKTLPSDEMTVIRKVLLSSGLLAIEALLSWINVVVITWQIIKKPLHILREAITPKPEVIRRLRFPLWNNPEMTPESVWAHLQSLNKAIGESSINHYQLLSSLDQISDYQPFFNKREALNHLSELGVVNEDTIMNAITYLDEHLDESLAT